MSVVADEMNDEIAEPQNEAAEAPRAEPPMSAPGPDETAADSAAEAASAPSAVDAAAAAEPTAAAPEAAPKPRRAPRRKPAATPAPAAPAAEAVAVAGHLEAVVVDADGRRVDTVGLSAARFGVTPEINTLHLAVRAQQAARRSGTASTKTRGEVSGTTAKMYRQKGTGRARAGSVKSPIRTGGGVVFGPHPRSYGIKINRKVARKALVMALSSRADAGSVFVARGLELERPSTAEVNRMLVTMDIAAPVLVITAEEPTVTLSVRNLAFAETTEVQALSTEQILRARSLIFTEKAFAALERE